MNPEEARFQWATHRTLDPTGLLRVKVTLRRDRQHKHPTPADDASAKASERKSGEGEEPEKEPETHGSDGDEHPHEEDARSDAPSRQDEVWTREIAWQERLFSHTEVKACREGREIGVNPGISAKYIDAVRNRSEEDPNYNGDVIYTKVVEDRYIDPSEIDRPFGKIIGERPPTNLAEAVLQGEGLEEVVDVVHTAPQTMHFFASIPCADGTYHEELLGLIRVYPGGRIDVRPPFSNKTTPPTTYKFFTKSNELLYFTIEVIEDKNEEESPFERTLLCDIKRRRAIFEAAQSECALAQPPEPPGTIRMFYRGEIATVQTQSVDSVAVDYAVRFPPGWELEEPTDPVVGSSQLAICRDDDGVAYINMPIEFVAKCRTQMTPMLEVCLHTYTKSHARVTVGYGTCPLPVERGCHEIKFETWRVRGAIMDELRLQFLDSGLEIQPSVEQGLSNMFDTDDTTVAMNKFGLHTVGTGKVTVKINLAQQSSLFKTSAQQQQQPMSTLGSVAMRNTSRMSSVLSRNNLV